MHVGIVNHTNQVRQQIFVSSFAISAFKSCCWLSVQKSPAKLSFGGHSQRRKTPREKKTRQEKLGNLKSWYWKTLEKNFRRKVQHWQTLRTSLVGKSNLVGYWNHWRPFFPKVNRMADAFCTPGNGPASG